MRLRFLAAAALLPLALALTACDSDGETSGSPAPTPTEAVEVAPTAPAASPVSRPDATATLPPTPEVTPGPQTRTPRVAVIDVHGGDGRVLDTPSEITGGHEFYPAFTPDSSGIWLTHWTADTAYRFGLDGAVEDEIVDSSSVVESHDGHSRLFARGEEPITIVEHAGTQHEFDGQWNNPLFSPDGRTVAFHTNETVGDGYPGTLYTLNLGTMAITEHQPGIAPCHCDGGPIPRWSPDGRFFAFVDFGATLDVDAYVNERGLYVLDTATGSVRRVSDSTSMGYPTPWRPDSTLLVREDDRVAVVDPATGEHLHAFDAPGQQGGLLHPDPSGRAVIVSTWDGEPPPTSTLAIYEVDSGAHLGDWSERPHIAITPDGPVVAGRPAADHIRDAACTGAEVRHPALEDSVRCVEGTPLGISPDGRHLVMRQGAGVAVVDMTTGEEAAIDLDPGLSGSPIARWNAEGTHVLIAWGFGL